MRRLAEQHIYTLDEIRKITVPIAERYRLKKLSLFGSYARGEASESSDIDFYAEFPEAFGLFRLGNLQKRCGGCPSQKGRYRYGRNVEPIVLARSW
ncbi:MAG: nucleotidyltransferase family protein [Christensenellales bacterium]